VQPTGLSVGYSVGSDVSHRRFAALAGHQCTFGKPVFPRVLLGGRLQTTHQDDGPHQLVTILQRVSKAHKAAALVEHEHELELVHSRIAVSVWSQALFLAYRWLWCVFDCLNILQPPHLRLFELPVANVLDLVQPDLVVPLGCTHPSV